MARVPVPNGYASWNEYIEAQADASIDQSIEARRLVKRNIKLGLIAQVDRQTAGNAYRDYNVYSSPGTVSPATGHPWTLTAPAGQQITLTDGSTLVTTTGDTLVTN